MPPIYIKLRGEIATMLDERFFPLWWLENEISDGRIVLLHNDEAVIGISRKQYPGGALEIHGEFAAGALEAIGNLVDEALQMGEDTGCGFAAIESRAGWSRAFKAKGFAVDRTRIVKELN